MIILKGRVIDGTGGHPIEKGLVAFENNRIKAVCRQEDYQIPDDVQVIEMDDATIMPGFIDCHTHLCSLGMDTKMSYVKNNYEMLIESVRDAENLLMAGFTSIREMSLFGPYIKNSIDRGIIKGPRMMVGGRMLTVTAGHGDMYPFPIPFADEQNVVGYRVDGLDGCLRGVWMQFREGAQFIKIATTGGVMCSGANNEAQFSPEELKVIMEETKRRGTYVAAHAHKTEGILDALKAGVTSIEHGTFLNEECIELMVKNDATYDPTLSILKIIVGNPDAIPEYAYQKGLACVESHLKSMELAREAGLRIALGSDFLGGDSELTAYGKNGIEFVSLVESGLTPMESIVAGTKNGSHLMLMKNETGTLEAGKLADIVIVKGNPLENIKLLADSDHIKVVIKDGKIEKNIIRKG